MKRCFNSSLLILAVLLSSYIISSDKPKVANNTWSYDAHVFHADTSYLSNANKVQFDFRMLDSARELIKMRYIGMSFNKWPVPAGDYRIVSFVTQDDEATILASDPVNFYKSKHHNTGGVLHVTVDKEGKHTFWANKVAMEVFLASQSHWTGDQDSTFFSFNLTQQ